MPSPAAAPVRRGLSAAYPFPLGLWPQVRHFYGCSPLSLLDRGFVRSFQLDGGGKGEQPVETQHLEAVAALSATVAVPMPLPRILRPSGTRSRRGMAAAAALPPPAVALAVPMPLFLSAPSPFFRFAATAFLLRMLLSVCHLFSVQRFHDVLLFETYFITSSEKCRTPVRHAPQTPMSTRGWPHRTAPGTSPAARPRRKNPRGTAGCRHTPAGATPCGRKR